VALTKLNILCLSVEDLI